MSRKRAIPKSKTAWLTIIKEYLDSGLSKEKFCQERHLNVLTFKSRYYYLNPKIPLKPTQAMQSDFIPVTIPLRTMHSVLSIGLPNGIKLDITGDSFDSHQLQALLRVCCHVVNG